MDGTTGAGTNRTVAVRVGRIGRAHGIKGDVTVQLFTDEPERRFAPGARLRVVAPKGRARDSSVSEGAGFDLPAALTVAGIRWHRGVLLVRFEQAGDRTAVEQLRGVVLEADVPAHERPDDPEEFYDRDLIGLAVVTADAETADPIGSVQDVIHGPDQDLLQVERADGTELLVPFVQAWVPRVDLAAGRLTLADPDALIPQD